LGAYTRGIVEFTENRREIILIHRQHPSPFKMEQQLAANE